MYEIPWEWDASVLIGCAGLVYLYLVLVRFKISGRAGFFAAGVALILVALVSPLHPLSDVYLFSIHMVQHMLLIQLIPPLLLLGLPEKPMRQLLKVKFIGKIERILGIAPVAWGLGIGTLWAWHIPAFYQATLENHSIHIAEHVSFLVTGIIFWWPVLNPVVERRTTNLRAVFHLISAALACSLLGVFLFFAPKVLYPGYLNPVDKYGLLPLVRQVWGISALGDQQTGGLIMWAFGGLSYLVAVLGVLGRWYSQTSREIRLEIQAQMGVNNE